MQVGLTSHEANEHWEGVCGCRGTSEGTRSPKPTQGPPSSEFQSWEKESPQNLTIKTSGTLAVWVRWKEPENQDVPLKGLCKDSLTGTLSGCQRGSEAQ